jgi:xanthine dehydrogenase accessory factor
MGGDAGKAGAAAVIPSGLSERARDLRAHGEPFVTATVVRTQKPTSAQAGNVALVRRDGTIEGFVGGVCAQHSVRLYSLQAIETGQPLLLRIMPEGPGGSQSSAPEPTVDDGSTSLSGHELSREDGTVTVRNPCLSGGAVELFLEPELPAPRVLVAGESPIVGALKSIGPALGLELVAGVDRAEGSVSPRAGDLGLIVAAHGRGEIEALRAGLEAGLPYVGLVASPKRGAAVLGDLRAEGVPEELVARIDSPAGLDIGARTAAEIALSILTQIVMVRRGRRDAVVGVPAPAQAEAVSEAGSAWPTLDDALHVVAAGAPAPVMAVDPICGMTVVVVPGTPSSSAEGDTSYFCCESCQATFDREHRAA